MPSVKVQLFQLNYLSTHFLGVYQNVIVTENILDCHPCVFMHTLLSVVLMPPFSACQNLMYP